LWFKANYKYQKVLHDRDYRGWETEHLDLVEKCATELAKRGFEVVTECEFEVEGQTAVIAGKADIIAEKPDSVIIIDCKTGQEKAAHRVQVLIYLWALRQIKAYERQQMFGEVRYKEGAKASVAPAHLTDEFLKSLREAIQIASSKDPPAKKPSASECKFCDIPQEECPEKEKAEKLRVRTDFF
jgi:RecB family exonuclease